MASRKLPTLLRFVAVQAAILVAGALLIELALGTWLWGSKLGALNVHAGIERRITGVSHYPPDSPAFYRRDRYGLRGDFGTPSAINILTVGGSTTNEMFVDERQTWSAVMQAELRRHGVRATVANAGVDGASTAGHLRAFRQWFPEIPKLKPRYVVFFVGVNDRGVEPDREAQSDSLVHTDWTDRVRTFVENHSALVRGYRTIHGWFIARRLGVIHGTGRAATSSMKWVPRAPDPTLAARLKPRLDAYERRIEKLDAAARAIGAMPLYMTQINGDGRRENGQIVELEGSNGASVFAEIELYNDRLRAFCARTRAICLDMARSVRFEPGDFYDSVHTTPSGSRKIGQFAAEAINRIGE